MSYEFNELNNNDALNGVPYGDATFVTETPAVTISETQAAEPTQEIHGDMHDTCTIPAPDERGHDDETPLIYGARAYEDDDFGAGEENGLGFSGEEYYLGQGYIEDEYEASATVSPSRTVYVAANYASSGRDDLPEGVVDLAKKDVPVAAADVPPETPPPTEEATASAEEPNDAKEIAEKIVEMENIPNEATEDREARTEALANVVQDAIDTSKALEAAQQELETLKEDTENLVVQNVVSGDIPSGETEEQRNERLDRVADALADAAVSEAEARDDEDRDPGDLLNEFVDPSDVTRLGFTEGKVDIVEPPAPVETSTSGETSTPLQPGETRILGEDGWQVENASDYDPSMRPFVEAPMGTAIVGRAPETGERQTYSANSEGRVVTLWKSEASGLVHIDPENMTIGTEQIDAVISAEPGLAGPGVVAHVIGDVETSSLGEEITSEQNEQLASYLRSRGIRDITVVSQGRGKDVSLGVRTGRVDVKDADGGEIYTNRPSTSSSQAATE